MIPKPKPTFITSPFVSHSASACASINGASQLIITASPRSSNNLSSPLYLTFVAKYFSLSSFLRLAPFVADIDASPSRTSLAVAWSIIARASSACPCPLAYCPAQSPSSSTSFHRTPALSR